MWFFVLVAYMKVENYPAIWVAASEASSEQSCKLARHSMQEQLKDQKATYLCFKADGLGQIKWVEDFVIH